MTRQRQVIYNILKNSGHLTAEEIFVRARKQLPHIAMGTVYRNLGLMVESGEIGHIAVFGAPDIYDRLSAPHEHCVCERCGKVCDIHVDNLKSRLEEILGTQITDYKLDVRYLCDDCKNGCYGFSK